jgi:hypothetical protein
MHKATKKYLEFIKENGVFENDELIAKRCTECNEILFLDEFRISTRNPNLHRSKCKICERKKEGVIVNIGSRTKAIKLVEQNKKHCPTCDTTKDLNEFTYRSTKTGKRYFECKECKNNKKREKRKHDRDLEK